jgi:hypothetical protein
MNESVSPSVENPSTFLRFGGSVKENAMGTILWLLSVVLVVVGIVELLQGAILFGIILIVLGLLVGPGSVSVFNGRRA